MNADLPIDERGVTLFELLVAVTILFTLASVAVPLRSVAAKRMQELELRQKLREMRTAIDTFRTDWARDGDILLGVLCQENKLTCKDVTGLTGYPKTMTTLLGVELSGKKAVTNEQKPVRRYLRRIPVDPLTGSADWGLRCYQDPPDIKEWCSQDVYDVYSKSPGIGLDRTNYRDW